MEKSFIENKNNFMEMDVRGLKGNFLPAILKKATQLKKGEGIKIIQNFEPIPLHATMEKMGFDYQVEKKDNGTYEVFYSRINEIENPDNRDLPLKPIVMPRYADIDPELADMTVNFWNYIWNKKNSAIKPEIKFLLSLANAVGAGRFKQASRELIKSYYLGVTVEQMDELFSLFVWNQGTGYFSSEIVQSPLFKVYQYIKNSESKNQDKKTIMEGLMEKFGEKNSGVGFSDVNKQEK